MIPFLRLAVRGLLLRMAFPLERHSYRGLFQISESLFDPGRKTAQVFFFDSCGLAQSLPLCIQHDPGVLTFPPLPAFELLLGKALADLEAGQTSRMWGWQALAALTVVAVATGTGLIALAGGGNHTGPHTLTERSDRNPEMPATAPSVVSAAHLGNFPPPFTAGVSDRRHNDRLPSSRFFVRSPQTLDRLLRISDSHDDRGVPFIQ